MITVAKEAVVVTIMIVVMSADSEEVAVEGETLMEVAAEDGKHFQYKLRAHVVTPYSPIFYCLT